MIMTMLWGQEERLPDDRPTDEPDELMDFVEAVAVFYETFGLPRIAGRILGYLLVCEPPERTAKQLIEELGASRGSVTNMLRLLTTGSVVQIVGRPGDRSRYYRVRDDGFDSLVQSRMAQYVGFGPLADRGLAVLRDMGVPASRTRRLRTQRAMYRFLEREFGAMAERWFAQREALIAEEES